MQTRAISPERKRRSGTVSFRIDNDLRLALDEESKRLNINLNSLIIQLFSRYMSWDRYARKLKFLPVSKNLLRELFSAIEQGTAERIGKTLGETDARDEVLFLFQQATPSAVLRFVEIWTGHFEATEHRFDQRRHYYTVHHDVNLNFSLFAKQYISSMIQTTLGRIVQFETISPSSLTFNLEL